MRKDGDLVRQALRHPEKVPEWSLERLDLLVRQGRHANLLARLCIQLEETGALARLDPMARVHFEAARILADKHRRDVRWEVHCLVRALAHLPKVVLLKGGAYVMADLPPARGRIFSDIDLMVPKADLATAERALLREGWTSIKLNAYDQVYYRTWMHQLPPLMHAHRQTVVDVHHAIVPQTARSRVPTSTLLDAARPLPGFANLYVLAPVDMVLHSAVHLFNGGEYEIGLRDLCDIQDLVTHFGRAAGFWDDLWQRASDLGLNTPLYLALRHARDLLGVELPPSFGRALDAYARFRPTVRILHPLVSRAVRPDHVSVQDALTGFARWLLYVRGHYLRMPMHLLVPHLVRKAVQARLDPG